MMCRHEHGDFVLGAWVCGQCWKKLDERPRKYSMEAVLGGGEVSGDQPEYRQTVTYSPIRTAESGLTLSQFIAAMARYLMLKGGFSMSDATDYALSIMQVSDMEFADPAEDWSSEGAREIVREDMSYWDDDGQDGSNG